jgi:hypothetical protein
MKLPYREGSVFAVPLKNGTLALGVVARATKKGRVLLGYFFKEQYLTLPNSATIQSLKPGHAIKIIQFGDLHLIEGRWPIVGQLELWDRKDWPTVPFVRKHPITGKTLRIIYSDEDPNVVVKELPEPPDSTLERDSLYGAEAVEIALSKILV